MLKCTDTVDYVIDAEDVIDVRLVVVNHGLRLSEIII